MTERVKERDLESLKQFLTEKAELGERVSAALVLRIICQLVDELMATRRELNAVKNDKQATDSVV